MQCALHLPDVARERPINVSSWSALIMKTMTAATGQSHTVDVVAAVAAVAAVAVVAVGRRGRC